jgi:RNA polymerase sigma factor (sigma-70 family)
MTRLTLREDVAEDLLQDLFIRLSRSDAFARAGNPEGFACRAAMRLAFDWRRGQRRRPEQRLETAGRTADSPLQHLIDREEFDEVLEALGQLSEVRREVFILRHIQQQPYEAIAKALHRTTHQVRGICHKAIAQLRERLSRGAETEINERVESASD